MLFVKFSWECDSVGNATDVCVFFSLDLPVLFDKHCWECDNVDNASDVCVFFT